MTLVVRQPEYRNHWPNNPHDQADDYFGSAGSIPNKIFSNTDSHSLILLTSATGQCPHCSHIFVNPVALPCGHSLCRACSKELLTTQLNRSTNYSSNLHKSKSTVSSAEFGQSSRQLPQRNRIRMGINSLSRFELVNAKKEDIETTSQTNIPSSSSSTKLSKAATSGTSNFARNSKTRQLFKGVFLHSSNRMTGKIDEETGEDVQNFPRPTSTLLSTRHLYQSPKCPVCGAGPRLNAPIRNLALEQLVQLLLQQSSVLPGQQSNLPEQNPKHQDEKYDKEQLESKNSPTNSSASSIRSRSSSSGFDEISVQESNSAKEKPVKEAGTAEVVLSRLEIGQQNSEDLNPIEFVDDDSDEEIGLLQTCKIAIFGGPKIGKTKLASTQSLNNLFFGQINESESTNLTNSNRADDSQSHSAKSDVELRAKYRLCILDNNNLQQDLHEAHGIVLAYSTSDRLSFEVLNSLFQEIRLRRADDPPMVLVATKSDLIPAQATPRKRNNNFASSQLVASYEGQAMARSFNCPFLEVSSKTNDNVNEIFLQIIQIIDRRSCLNKKE